MRRQRMTRSVAFCLLLLLGGLRSATGQSQGVTEGADVLRLLTNRYSAEIDQTLQNRYILGYPLNSPLFTTPGYADFNLFGLEREAEGRAAAIAAFRSAGIRLLNELDVVVHVRKIVEQYTRAEVLVDTDVMEFGWPGSVTTLPPDRPSIARGDFGLSGGLPIGIQARFRVAGLDPRLTVYPASDRILSLRLERRLTDRTRIGLDYRLYREKQSVITTLSYAWTTDPDLPFWPAWLRFSP